MTRPNLGIIVFARMSSQRLPGKMLMDFGGHPLLAHILLRAAALGLPLVVATSDCREDDALVDLAERYGVPAFRGSLDDVLQRAVDCANAHGFDAFARLCGDRPYFPQEQMRNALLSMENALASGVPVDLISNHFPASPPLGLTTEVVRVAALQRALDSGATAHNREHLTSYLYMHEAGFTIEFMPTEFVGLHGQRFAVDTEQDYHLLRSAALELADVNASHEAVAAWLPAPVNPPAEDSVHG